MVSSSDRRIQSLTQCFVMLMQLREQLTAELQRRSPTQSTVKETADGPKLALTSLQLISILKSYQALGYHPSQGLLTATEPFLTGGPEPLPLQPALDLISLFTSFHWQPGTYQQQLRDPCMCISLLCS